MHIYLTSYLSKQTERKFKKLSSIKNLCQVLENFYTFHIGEQNEFSPLIPEYKTAALTFPSGNIHESSIMQQLTALTYQHRKNHRIVVRQTHVLLLHTIIPYRQHSN